MKQRWSATVFLLAGCLAGCGSTVTGSQVVKQYAVLILDEATASLDPASEAAIQGLRIKSWIISIG